VGGIDGENLAEKASVQQVLEHGASDAAGAFARPNHGYPLGLEEGVEGSGLGTQEVVRGIAGLGGSGLGRHPFNIYFRPPYFNFSPG
jgi:hypothetical protein